MFPPSLSPFYRQLLLKTLGPAAAGRLRAQLLAQTGQSGGLGGKPTNFNHFSPTPSPADAVVGYWLIGPSVGAPVAVLLAPVTAAQQVGRLVGILFGWQAGRLVPRFFDFTKPDEASQIVSDHSSATSYCKITILCNSNLRSRSCCHGRRGSGRWWPTRWETRQASRGR